jgi:hypothetical protein
MHPIMRRSGRALGLATFFPTVIALSVPLHADPVNAPGLIEKVDAIFLKWNKPNVPGCALGIEQQGRSAFSRVFLRSGKWESS